MRVEDLQHEELLQLDPESGLIRFAGQRALLIDAVAMGLLRKYLVENFGLTAARAVLTQFGFAHGWRMAAAMRAEFDWESDEDLRLAGTRIHCLEGLFTTSHGSADPLTESGVCLVSSYEAEQHLLHFGQSEQSGCWTIAGLISGYLSQTTGNEIFVLEDRCMSRGNAACQMVGRTREEWGEERASELAFFDSSRLEDCLEVSLARVIATLKEAEEKLNSHRAVLKQVVPDVPEPLGLVAKSGSMRRAVDLACRAASVDVTVLISGESGVGKERIARLIHAESTRANAPFIAINCGAITESLLESELFGHKRGAFTGAAADRIGLFESANHGTILLDEIGEVSPGMQVKLLRVLQEREVRRVGENRNRPINTRILAATNRSLTKEIEAGRFRQDLYYRLRVVEIEVPALRERPADILPLARVLLENAKERMAREVAGFSPAVADQLLRYHWPGNVRELENAMERSVALARGSRVEVEDLPEELRGALRRPVVGVGKVLSMSEVEQQYIESVLELNDGNRGLTAEQLDIGSATLYRKLKAYAAAEE